MQVHRDFWSLNGVVDRVIQELDEYAIFCLDTQGRVMTWNAGAERMFGYGESEMLGASGEILFTPEDRHEGIPRQEMRVATKEGRASDERFHLKANGARFWVSGILIAVHDALGQHQGFVKIVRDTGDQKVTGMSIRIEGDEQTITTS